MFISQAIGQVGPTVMAEEGNCEDAVLGIAYEAYKLITHGAPLADADLDLMDDLQGRAADYVRANIDRAGFEWEEYR